MIRVSDPSFELPVIHGTTFSNKLQYGKTKPIIILGHDTKTTNLNSYVTKPIGFPEMSIEKSLREILASFIAIELELKVPNPALMYISNEFLEANIGNEYYSMLENSIGYNFSTKYLEGFHNLSVNELGVNANYFDLLNIFLFDILIDNCDRRQENPNLLTNSEEIYIIDHELAFTFILELFPNAEPWKITDSQLQSYRNHILFRYLKKKNNFDYSFVDSFERLENSFWNKVETLIPKEWSNQVYEKIKTNILIKIDNLNNYREEIRRVLL